MREVVVGDRIRDGSTIVSLGLKNCVVVAIRRGDDLITPKGATRLNHGDVLTILGEEDALDRALGRLE